MSSLDNNVITITDASRTIASMTFVSGSVDCDADHDDAATIQQSGNVFTITLAADRKASSSVASSFNAACGGATHEYAAVDGGGTPNELNFYFAVQINATTASGNGSTTLYIGQGNSGLTNNWWLGGSGIDSSKPSLSVPLDDGVHTLTVPLSGSSANTYTFSAGTVTDLYSITHIFVLMLENHSFDNMFAMSGIPGITAATTVNSNTCDGTTYFVTSGAPTSMPIDPGHEFPDVVEQLGGQGATYPSGGPYPPINNSGYVANYVANAAASAASDVNPGGIMACFNTPQQLPVLYQLATTFTVCDHWFSSLPGPTWPNRFFVHGASSSGLDHSPTKREMGTWEFVLGFPYPHGSIFDALRNSNITYRLYADVANSFSAAPGATSGSVPQVSSIAGIGLTAMNSLTHFASDLQNDYPAQYTFIEPNYGHVASGTYANGSSQHPMDDLYGGEGLIKYVYESIRNSPLWNKSLLIITYDEHGGFYDSVIPGAVTPPNDGSSPALNEYGFTFDTLGTRVPAVVISPWVKAGVSSVVYDHSTVLATVEKLLGVHALTDRDAQASSLYALLQPTARTDCPTTLNSPVPPTTSVMKRDPDRLRPNWRNEPLPEQGHIIGTLAIMLKTELELSDGSPAAKAAILTRFRSIQTRGEADAYIKEVLARAEVARALKI